MPVHLPHRLARAFGSALLLVALPAAANSLPIAPVPVAAAGEKYGEAELRLIHDEAVATGGATYKFYILGSDDRSTVQDAWSSLEAGRAKGASMKKLFSAELRQQQAFALPQPAAGRAWRRFVDTACAPASVAPGEEPVLAGQAGYAVSGESVVVLVAE